MSDPVALSFSHLGLFVNDLSLMKTFYTQIMGFYVSDEGCFDDGQSLVFLTRDPQEHHQIVLVAGAPLAAEARVINQISFFVQDLSALQVFYRVVAEANVAELESITHGNAWSLYFRDPEHNRIEVYTHTPWYVTQPLREVIDLGQSVEQIYAATEALCRRQPGFQTRAAWLDSMREMMGRD